MTAASGTDARRADGGDPGRGQGLAIALIVVAVASLVVAAELTHIHYKVNTDETFSSFCNIGDAVNCETVAASSYSVFFGVPLSVWGLFAYAVLLGLGLAGVRRSAVGGPAGFPGLVFLWGLVAFAVTGILAYISVTKITSLCLLCVALYLANTTALVLGFVCARRNGGGIGVAIARDLRRIARAPLRSLPILAGLLGIAIALMAFYPRFTFEVETPPAVPGAEEGCGSSYHTADGFPATGGTTALVTLEEFSDYQCGYCRKAHALIRKLVEVYGGKLRVVHRHFPLDHACNSLVKRNFHDKACLAARAAICADHQGRFWDYNDVLWEKSPNLERKHLVNYARAMGLDVPKFETCLTSQDTEIHLQRDIRDGIGWGVSGTPSFVINGTFVKGALKEEAFRKLIDEALSACQ